MSPLDTAMPWDSNWAKASLLNSGRKQHLFSSSGIATGTVIGSTAPPCYVCTKNKNKLLIGGMRNHTTMHVSPSCVIVHCFICLLLFLCI